MNLSEQDIVERMQAVVLSHKPSIAFKTGPYSYLLDEDLTISNSMCFLSPVVGGGDLGLGTATYNFQIFMLTKTTKRSGSVEGAFTQSELYLARVLNKYFMTHEKDRLTRDNRQRINPGQLKSNAVGFLFDIAVTVPAPFSNTAFDGQL